MAQEVWTFIKVGPGGEPGSKDTLWDGKGNSKITCIFMSYGGYRISSFQYEYIEDGVTKLSPVYGHHIATTFTTVEFNHPDEYLVGLSGKTEFVCGKTKLIWLSFETNVKVYGPFGTSFIDDEPTFSFQFGSANRFGGFMEVFTMSPYKRRNSLPLGFMFAQVQTQH